MLCGNEKQNLSNMPIIYSKVTTEPSIEPITLTEAKVHLKVDHTDEDSLITILIQGSRETIEQRTNRSLITQTRTIKLDYFPWSQTICLPDGPLISVTSVKYYDENLTFQTFSSSDYWVDTNSNIPRVIVKDSWPGTYAMPNAVEIIYSAGYGASGSYVPKALKQAMYLIIGHLYENREQVGDIRYDLPFGVDHLISPYVLEQKITY